MAFEDQTRQDMESGLEHAVRVVQAWFVQFEQKFFNPCLETGRRFAHRYPITATFLTLFFLLSFLPIATFLGFSVLVTATLTFVALACTFVISTVLIIVAAGLLALTLTLLFVISLFLTVSLVSLFVTVRLGQCIRSENDVKKAVTYWARETRGRFRWRSSTSVTPEFGEDVYESKVKKEPSGPSGQEEWQAVIGGHT